MQRLQLLENWLRHSLPQLTQFSSQFLDQHFAISPASADASFRRYFRVPSATDLIAMDAPPQQEDCGLLCTSPGYSPQRRARARNPGPGSGGGLPAAFRSRNTTYLQALNEALNEDPDNAGMALLYRDAVAALLKIQLASAPGVLPEYDEALLLKELNLFPDWYLGRHLQVVPEQQPESGARGIFQTDRG